MTIIKDAIIISTCSALDSGVQKNMAQCCDLVCQLTSGRGHFIMTRTTPVSACLFVTGGLPWQRDQRPIKSAGQKRTEAMGMAAFRVCQAAPIITLSGQHLCHLNNGGASSALDFGHIRLSPQTTVVCEGSPYVSGVLRLLLVES